MYVCTDLPACVKPLLNMLAREDFVIVNLVTTAHHGMQRGLGMLTQHIPPQHKLRRSQTQMLLWSASRVALITTAHHGMQGEVDSAC